MYLVHIERVCVSFNPCNVSIMCPSSNNIRDAYVSLVLSRTSLLLHAQSGMFAKKYQPGQAEGKSNRKRTLPEVRLTRKG